MSRSKSEQTSLSYLQSISTHNQPVQLKGATISFFQFQACPLLEAFLFFISYIQLIAQAFIVNPYFGPFPGDDSTSQFLLDNLSFISKIFAPGASGMYQTTLNVLFVCLLGQHLIRISFTMYIALAVRRDFEPNRILLGIWRMYCKLHDRMICFITSSLWLSLAMNAQHEDSTPFGIDSTAVIVICVLFISHDFLHAITMNVRYNVLLPTKDTLQPKTNTEKMWILTQKALFQILFLFLTPNDLANAWFVASLNLAFSILNNIHCYMKYPFYSLKTMSWYSTMLSITTALNLSFFLRLILDAADEENKVTFAEVIVYWLVFSVLMVKGGYGYLKKIMIDLVTKKKTVRPEMLVHKIFVIKELRKLQKPSTDHSPNYEWTHLIYTTFKKNIHEVFDIDPSEVKDLDFDNKEDSYRLISLYLDGLMEKYPKSCLVKLYAAYYHGKKLKEYTSAMKLLLDLQKSPSKQIVWNSLHFLETMQLAVQEGYKSVDSEIDLAKYIQNVMTVNKLKERILKQARLQLDIFKENNKNQPDLGKIYDKSQKVIASREKIEKITLKIMKKFPDYYLEPQLLLAYYNSILNFSSLDYIKHQKMYRNNFEKYHRKLEEDVLSGNNLYEKETGLIVITSEIRKTAAISYCSKSAQGIFGRDLKGAQAFTIMPPMLQNFYFEVFRDPEENKEFLGKIHRTFLLHRDDYLIEADFYFNIHPFISRGLNYNLLVRPVQNKKEHIIISTTGIIEGFSAGIGALLHLHAAKKANAGINHISKELARSSEACNTIMNSLVKRRTNHTQTQGSQAAVADSRVSVDNHSFHSKEYEKAQNTWNIINTEGRDLMLRPYKDKSQQGGGGFKSGFWDEPIVYHCKMSVQHYGTKVMKVVSLEELLNDYDSEQEIKVQRRTTGNRTDASKSTFKSKDEQIIIEAEYSFKGSVEEIALEGADTTKRKDTSRSTNVLILPSTERNTENLESTSRNTKRAPKISIDRREVKSRTFSSGAKVVSPLGNQVTVIEEDDEEDEHEKEEDAKEVKVIHISPLLRKDSKESPKSKSSTQEKVCRAMKEAFNIKFYPRYIQGFKVKFYFLFTAVFIAQIFLNVNVKNTTDQFSGIKNILKNISDKEGIFTDAYLDLLFMIDLADGRLSEDDLGFLGRPVEVYNWQLQDDMTELVQVTNNVIKASKLLNNENRDELYQSNVNYYDTDFSDSEQTYVELNGFLASQRLVETFLRGLALAETDFGAAMVYFKQILRNTLNDVLLETDNSFNFFTARLTKEKESFERGAKIVLALTLAMLAIKIVGSGALIWYQYKTESLILLAFVKLNKDKINYISANINSFRQVILAETSLEDAHFDDCLKANHYQKVTEKKKVKAAHKYESVTPKFQGIIRRYALHFIKLLMLIFAILAYTIMASIVPQKTVSDLYKQVEQAGFSDSIGINCDLALISSHLALTDNNENILMMNTPVAVVFPFEIEVVQGYISQILASVSDTEWNYGEAVSDIFYGDGCGYALTDQYAKFVCQLFSTDSEKTNIISLLGYFQGALRDRYNKYNASDKSYESLRNITIETFDGVTMPHTVLHVLTEYISDLVDEIYDESTDSATRKSTLNLCLICVLLFLTGTLSWWAVIRPVQETDNKMKNVLQMLPPNLVLSNFILKNYLVKTSYGALNVIRNNI